MKHYSRYLVLPLCLLLAQPVLAQEPEPASNAGFPETGAIAASTAQLSLPALSDQQGLLSAALERYAEALRGNGVEAALAELEHQALTARTAEQQAQNRAIQGILAWQAGELTLATEALSAAAERLPADSPGAGSLQAIRAQALLADGQRSQASEAFSLTSEQALVNRALLRDTPQALIKLAEQLPARKIPIARLLALSGHPGKALSLIDSNHADEPSLALEMIDWMIDYKQFARGAELAWQAYRQATQRSDKRYALALFAEAWRRQGKLQEAGNWLAGQAAEPDILQLRVDILAESQRYDEALALIQSAGDPEIRQRQSALLELAGRTNELASLYQQQIDEHPDQLSGYSGLAGMLVNEGDTGQAAMLFNRYAERHAGNNADLLDAARRMIAMGLTEPAIDMVNRFNADATVNTGVRQFLFETYMASGDEQAAAEVLADVNAQLPADSLSRIQLSENYERLHRTDTAIDILTRLEKQRGGLSYDQRLHLAALEYKAGRAMDALNRWQTLWGQATLPARRQFLENRIINVARETGYLNTLADALWNKLATRQASQADTGLLVSIELAMENRERALSAIGTLSEQGRISETDMLQMQARLYGQQRDYPALNQVWERLAVLDPANADTYWQQITLNTLRNHVRTSQQTGSESQNTPTDTESARGGFTENQHATVEQLLTRLQATSPALTDAEFAAGIFAMAGLPDEAAKRYQLALLEKQDNSTALLQLVQLLKNQGRSANAVARLKYALLYARSPQTRDAAMDGLLSLLASSPEEAGNNSSNESNALRSHTAGTTWLAHYLRVQLILGDDTTQTLYTLADLAQQQADYGMMERAQRTLAAMNSGMRNTILRGLVTFYGGAKDAFSTSPAFADSDRKLKYGRRLLRLRPSFPPAFYADLADTLLAQKQFPEAEQAFALITDIPGLVSVRQIKGDAYARIGLSDNALSNFRQALVVDQSNTALLIKTAVLESQSGHHETAAYWYWTGLKQLLRQLPLRAESNGGAGLLDYNRFAGTLSEGLVLSLLAIGANNSLAEEIDAECLHTLVRSGLPEQGARLENAPRLQACWQLAQQLGFAITLPASPLAEEMKRVFADDNMFVRQQHHTMLMNSSIQQLTSGMHSGGNRHGWPLQQLRTQAADAQNFPLQMALALADQNWQEVRSQIDTVVAARNSELQDTDTQMLRRQYYPMLMKTLQQMPFDDFMATAWPGFNATDEVNTVWFDLWRAQPDYYQQIERALRAHGEKLFTDDELIAAVTAFSATPVPSGLVSQTLLPDETALLTARLNPDQLLTLYQQLQEKSDRDGQQAYLQSKLLSFLLNQPLSSSQRQRLQQLVSAATSSGSAGQEEAVATGLRWLKFDIDTRNKAVVMAALEQIARRCQPCEVLPEIADAWFSGKNPQAFAMLLSLREQIVSPYAQRDADNLIARFFAEEKQRYSDAFISRLRQSNNAVSESELDAFFTQIVSTMAPSARLLALYQALHDARPDDVTLMAGLLALQWQQEQVDAFVDSLSGWLEKHPDEEQSKLAWLAQQIQRGAVGDDTAFADVEALKAWLNLSRRGPVESLFVQVFATFSERFSGNRLVVALNEEQANQGGEQATPPNLTSLAERFRTQPDDIAGRLNTLWRNGFPGQKQFDDSGLDRERLLHTRYDLSGNPIARNESMLSPQPVTDLLTELAASPEVTTLFQHWLLALPDDERFSQQRLYDLIVAGLKAQKQLPQTITALFGKAGTRNLTAHEFQLLVTALSALPANDASRLNPALTEIAATQALMTPETRIALSRLLVDGEDYQSAGDLLKAAFWQLQYPAATIANRMAATRAEHPAFGDIVDALGRWKNSARAGEVLQGLLQQAPDEWKQQASLNTLWRSFVLQACYRVAGTISECGQANAVDKNAVDKNQAAGADVNNPSLNAALLTSRAAMLLQSRKPEHAAVLVSELLTAESSAEQRQGFDRELLLLAGRLYGAAGSTAIEQRSADFWLDKMINDLRPADKVALREALYKLAASRSRQHADLSQALSKLFAQPLAEEPDHIERDTMVTE